MTSSHRKHLTDAQKKEIWTLHKSGIEKSEISRRIGCTPTTISNWIQRMRPYNGDLQQLIISEQTNQQRHCLLLMPKRRKIDRQKLSNFRLGKSKKMSSRPLDRGLCEKMIQLYEKFGSATKVALELEKNGIHLSIPTIFKRMRMYARHRSTIVANHCDCNTTQAPSVEIIEVK